MSAVLFCLHLELRRSCEGLDGRALRGALAKERKPRERVTNSMFPYAESLDNGWALCVLAKVDT
jgi:hypothetical protein